MPAPRSTVCGGEPDAPWPCFAAEGGLANGTCVYPSRRPSRACCSLRCAPVLARVPRPLTAAGRSTGSAGRTEEPRPRPASDFGWEFSGGDTSGNASGNTSGTGFHGYSDCAVSQSCEATAPMTPAERALRARMAAYTLHAKRDARETTAAARAAFLDRFDRMVDPEGALPEAERQRRAAAARKAYFTRLALRSAQARRARAAGSSAQTSRSRAGTKETGNGSSATNSSSPSTAATDS